MFASLSLFPEFYKKHMQRFVAIAPVLSVVNCTSIFIQKHHKDEGLVKSLRVTQGCEVFKIPGAGNFVTKLFEKSYAGKAVAQTVMSETSDSNPELNHVEGGHNYMNFFPAGSSLKCLLHYKQLLITGQFARYDHGKEENLKRYGQEEPPKFDLGRV